ncbi:MAG: hypothetical protein OEU26_02030 [Candidatus Tectomicrobia bacterium]|nr:hypothetical protein [Candidatus Tectomicrobia bacterium]
MKKIRWRLVILAVSAVLLVVILTAIGGVMWLQKSGRLARFAQDAVQRLSGQNITLDAITFPAWNAVAVTDIRVQQPLQGRLLDIFCPRLEARFGLRSLLNKRAASVHVFQPNIQVSQQGETTTPPSDTASPTPIVLPANRVRITQGTVEMNERGTLYVLQQIEADLKQRFGRKIQIDARAVLGPGTATTINVSGRLGLDVSRPSGALKLAINSQSLPQLALILSGLLRLDQSVTQGALAATADITLQDERLQGNVRTQITQAQGRIAGVGLHELTVSSELTINGHSANRSLALEGSAQIQAERITAPSDLTAARLAIEMPLTLSYTPDAWIAQADLKLQSQTITTGGAAQLQQLSGTGPLQAGSTEDGWSLQGNLDLTAASAVVGNVTQPAKGLQFSRLRSRIPLRAIFKPDAWQADIDLQLRSQGLTHGDGVQASQLSSAFPLQIRSGAPGWQLQGTAEIDVGTVEIDTSRAHTPPARMTIDGVKSRLPVHLTSTRMTLKDMSVQAETWRWLAADAAPLQSPLQIRATSQLDFKRQRLTLQQLDATLQELGQIRGNAAWAWNTQTVHDLNIDLQPSTAGHLWRHVSSLIPEPYRTWQVDGQTRLELQTQQLSWRASAAPAAWTMFWHLEQVAFSSPEGDTAGENISGTLQAVVSPAANPSRYAIDGSLHLKPFSVLVGNFFPALEEQHVTSAITFSGAYHPGATRLDVQLDGQFGKLGRVLLRGALHRDGASRASGSWRYDLACTLRRLNAAQVWQTFAPQTNPDADGPSSTTVKGELNARLQLRGQGASAHLRGDVSLTELHLQTPSSRLQGVSLQLPIDVRYPLPQTLPDKSALPATAYGRLHIAQAQAGNIRMADIHTALALRSDSIIFQDHISIALLGGHVILRQLEAYRLLQAQRHIQLQLRLQALNLQQVQRADANLPLAGRVDADFPRVQVQGDRLATEGALHLSIAGGRVRIHNVQGERVFSRFPTLRAALKTEEPLSLLQLTQIYPIGGIGGTLHFTLDDLTVTAGEPEAFHLIFRVQAKGGEERAITLRALNNLLFTTGSAKVDAGQTYRLPYKRFGAEITLKHDTLRLRGLYHDKKGREYFMRAPTLGDGVSIINRVPQHGVPFRNFVQRLTATVLDKPAVSINQ